MRIRVLGSRPASDAIREIVSRVVWRTAQPTQVVRRLQIPYWQDRGWVRSGNTYTGSYQTPSAAFSGHATERGSGNFEFFLHEPSIEIRSHSHWVCFQARGNGWYLVHMGKQPRDISSGILTIERLIVESYE